jgi:tetratricopeptide (TPR) repeat protein
MDLSALEQLRRKVEAGEPLSDVEFELLRTAAQSVPGPSLRLTVAHALMNAGAEREALRLLEVLRRDFPKEVQVRLGLAQALMSLERPADAEVELREALVLNPGDPEALKVLAVLALRRGESGRARAYVTEVLKKDPLDGEARLLQAELDSADLPPPKVRKAHVQRSAFISALVAALHRAQVPSRRQGRHLLVKLGSGEVARMDVGSLLKTWEEGEQELSAYVEELVARLQGLTAGVSTDARALEAQVRPVLRPADFGEEAVGALHRPGPAGLEVFYVLEDAEFVRYLPEAALTSAGLTREGVDAAAWRNLGARPGGLRPVRLEGRQVVLADAPTGLWAVAEGDGHDGARLLTAAQQQALAGQVGPGPWCVHLGWRELALVCREEDGASREALSRLDLASDGIPGLFRLVGERLERVED